MRGRRRPARVGVVVRAVRASETKTLPVNRIGRPRRPEERSKMSDPVVLPKFELPGDKPHWAVRAAWISAVVLLLSIVGLGAIIMHRRTLEVQTHLAKQEALARVKADAEAKVAAAAAAAKAAKEAELADKHAAEAAAAAAKAAAAQEGGGVDASAKVAGKSAPHAHRSHAGHGSHGDKNGKLTGGKVAGKDSSGNKGGGKGPKSDPIDDLLKKMK